MRALRRTDTGRADRVAGHRGQRGGIGALPADVAHRDRPAAGAGLEDVVEVAADVVGLARGPEPGCDLEAGDIRQVRRQQALLESGRDVAALAVDPSVVDCDRRSPRELFDRRDLAWPEGPVREGCERDRAQRLPPGPQRSDHGRASRPLADVLEVLLVRGPFPAKLVRHLLDHLQAAGPHRDRDRMRTVELEMVHAQAIEHRLERLDRRRGCDSADHLGLVQQVDHAAVRQVGDGEIRDSLEGQVEIERCVELGTRAGEELELPAPCLEVRVQTRVVDRKRRPARQLGGEREIVLVEHPTRLRCDEGHGAEGVAARAQRHDHARAKSQLAHQSQVLFVLGAVHQQASGISRNNSGSPVFSTLGTPSGWSNWVG